MKLRVLLLILALVTALVWIAVLTYPDNNFHLIACDVGQGDAILATYKNTQILIDGGPDNKVLNCLGKHLPFWDRQIEMVILTHPEKDHFLGLIEVVQRYKVKDLVATALDPGSPEYEVLKDAVGGRGINVIKAQKGLRMRLGLIHLEIFWPSSSILTSAVSHSQDLLAIYTTPGVKDTQTLGVSSDVLGDFTSNIDPNEFSVVSLLSFGEFDALLTGDIPPEVSDKLALSLETNGQRPIDYLKVPHHGSKNGLTSSLVDAVKPKVAVISVGKDNTFGHPHQEVIKLLSDPPSGGVIKLLRTDETGDVEIESDGEKMWTE